jgi:hypothetical protein
MVHNGVIKDSALKKITKTWIGTVGSGEEKSYKHL